MEKTAGWMKNYGDWLLKALILLGVAANLWLTRTFVTRAEYEEGKRENLKEHLAINSQLVDIATTLKIMAATQVRLDDHETRVRTLEGRQIDVMSRLSSIERRTERQ